MDDKPKPFVKSTERFQREAAAKAYLDLGLTAVEVQQRALEGRLLGHDGKPLDSFKIRADYIRRLGRELRIERHGKRASQLSNLPARDATEALRIRLVNLADAELNRLERQPAGKRDLKRFIDVAKCVKEAASIVPPKEPQLRPGQSTDNAPGGVPGSNRPAGHRTTGGLTGSLLAEHRASARPSPAEGVSQNGEGPHEGGPSGVEAATR